MDKTVENNDILEQMFDKMLTFVHFCNKMFLEEEICNKMLQKNTLNMSQQYIARLFYVT